MNASNRMDSGKFESVAKVRDVHANGSRIMVVDMLALALCVPPSNAVNVHTTSTGYRCEEFSVRD